MYPVQVEREVVVNKRKDSPVRIDDDALDVARIVAAYRKIPLGRYVSEVLKAVAPKDLEREQAKKPPKSK